MHSNYLITMVLEKRGYFYHETEIFGDVEIRNSKHDFKTEVAIFRKSADLVFSGKLTLSEYDFSNRITTIVNAESYDDAFTLAIGKFIPVLDMKARELSLANINISGIGLIRNLHTGEVKPFCDKENITSGIFRRSFSDIQRYDGINYILSKVKSPVNEDTLASRYVRALHWAHNSRDEKNKQIKILFGYFCLEALFKENENDNISGMVRCFIGFPGGKQYKLVDENIISQLKENQDYLNLEKIIPILLDEVRIFRNNTVHSGFRLIDLDNKKLNNLNQLVMLAIARCLSAVEYAIVSENVETLKDFKDKSAYIFDKTIRIGDVISTIVNSLKYDN
ncbi:hypothetical protein [Morganella morganii]|uniref:hypothetical protein n=1 Tax=Morganella morganii TaxID=582 RepID=UPI0034D4BE39